MKKISVWMASKAWFQEKKMFFCGEEKKCKANIADSDIELDNADGEKIIYGI